MHIIAVEIAPLTNSIVVSVCLVPERVGTPGQLRERASPMGLLLGSLLAGPAPLPFSRASKLLKGIVM